MLPVDAQITFLPCSNLARSRSFYRDVLGLALVVDQGSCLIFRVREGAYVGVCTHLDAIRGRSVVVTIVTDDVDGWCRRIIANGGIVESGPEHNARYGIYHAFTRDPDGHYVEVQRFDDPSWSSPVA